MLTNSQEIGERIRNKRLDLNYKQQGFAEKIKIDKASLSRYEAGKQTPSLETLVAISKGLNVSLDYIIFGTGSEIVEKRDSMSESKMRKALRALVYLIEQNLIEVDAYTRFNTLSLGFNNNPETVDFYVKIKAFSSFRKQLDEKAYKNGIESLIAEYEPLIQFTKRENERFGGASPEKKEEYLEKMYSLSGEHDQ